MPEVHQVVHPLPWRVEKAVRYFADFALLQWCVIDANGRDVLHRPAIEDVWGEGRKELPENEVFCRWLAETANQAEPQRTEAQ